MTSLTICVDAEDIQMPHVYKVPPSVRSVDIVRYVAPSIIVRSFDPSIDYWLDSSFAELLDQSLACSYLQSVPIRIAQQHVRLNSQCYLIPRTGISASAFSHLKLGCEAKSLSDGECAK